MALPTAEEVTNMYLYGAKTRPVDLLDPGLLSHSASTTRNFIEVSEAEYIAGPGRFVSAANFKVIEDFFNDTSLAPNTYSKQDIFLHLGYVNANGVGLKDGGYTVNRVEGVGVNCC